MADALTFRLPPEHELRAVLIEARYELARVKKIIDDVWLEARQFTWDDVTREIGRWHDRQRFLERERCVFRVKDAAGTRAYRFTGSAFVLRTRGVRCPQRRSVRTLRPAVRRSSRPTARAPGRRSADPHDPDPEPDPVAVAHAGVMA